MYAYLKGTLIHSTATCVVVDVHGVGYQVLIPCSLLGALPQLGNPVQLYTSLVVREFSHALYGFLSAQDRELFESLMNVTGIGPKLALSLIGHLSFDSLQMAISQDDLITLCKVPGVGKKTAERLIVELRDKLPSMAGQSKTTSPFAMQLPSGRGDIQDAVLALINLGYTQNVAQKAVKQSLKELPKECHLAELITQSLKNV